MLVSNTCTFLVINWSHGEWVSFSTADAYAGLPIVCLGMQKKKETVEPESNQT